MSDDERRGGRRAALAHQPDWSRRHAEIMTVEPFRSLPAAQREEFFAAIAIHSDESELNPAHQRLLREARPHLEELERGRQRARARAEDGGS